MPHPNVAFCATLGWEFASARCSTELLIGYINNQGWLDASTAVHPDRSRIVGDLKRSGLESVIDPTPNPLPSGMRAIAALFVVCGMYLGVAGLLMLLRPGLLGMPIGAPLLFGLELSGPYMFLLMATVAAAIAFGLTKRNNIARHAAVLIAIAGVVMLVPSVSAAAVMVQAKALAFGGLGIIVRVVVAWYLSQSHVAEEFRQ